MRRIGTAALTIAAPAYDDDWRNEAACTTDDADLFFPDSNTGTGPAKAICAGCPVQTDCRQWSIDTKQEFGVFGGVDERERRQMLRRAGLITQHGPGRSIAECGTYAAYRRHIRRGEPVDHACATKGRYAKPLAGADEQAAA